MHGESMAALDPIPPRRALLNSIEAEVPDLPEDSSWRPGHLVFLVEASHDVILIVDSHQQVVHANRTVERVFGCSKTEILGRDFQSLFVHSEMLTEPAHFVDGVAGPFQVQRADGGTRYVEISAAFLPWRNAPAIAYTLRDVTEHHQLEEERERLIQELQEALAKVKSLSGLLPMCASCKRIRDFQGYWEQVEAYISAHSDAEFSHSICPDCREKLYPELGKASDTQKSKLVRE